LVITPFEKSKENKTTEDQYDQKFLSEVPDAPCFMNRNRKAISQFAVFKRIKQASLLFDNIFKNVLFNCYIAIQNTQENELIMRSIQHQGVLLAY
jgi:hypothetical protein